MMRFRTSMATADKLLPLPLIRVNPDPKPSFGNYDSEDHEGNAGHGMPCERPCFVKSWLLSALSLAWIGLFSDTNSFL